VFVLLVFEQLWLLNAVLLQGVQPALLLSDDLLNWLPSEVQRSRWLAHSLPKRAADSA